MLEVRRGTISFGAHNATNLDEMALSNIANLTTDDGCNSPVNTENSVNKQRSFTLPVVTTDQCSLTSKDESPLISPAPSITISVTDNSTGKVNSPLVLYAKRCRERICKHIKNTFAPSPSSNNIKFFGSKKRVVMERERSKTSGYVIHPLSNFRQYWDFTLMLVMLLNVFILPLDIAFFTDIQNGILFILSDVICILDIILNFRTGFRENPEDMACELRGKQVALHYMKTWFAVDLISVLPLNYIILAIYGERVSSGVKGASHAFKFTRIIKLIHLVKLLRLSRIMRGISMYEEVYRVTTTVIRYVKLIAMMMIVAHWNGCLHFLVPLLQDFPKDCWVRLSCLEGKAWYIQYGWALFKTLSHMLSIGYGRFTPILLSEALLTTFTMVTGATFYALFIAQSMAYMIECNYSKIAYMQKMKETDEYLAYRNVPEDLKQRVLTYFNQKYTHRRYFNEEQVLSEISKPIRDDIIRYTCRDVINSIPYLKDTSPEFLSTILDLLSSDVYLPGDIIMHEGNIGSEIYFVRHGEVEITVQGKVIETLNDGDYFGQCSVLVEQETLYSAKAIIPCDVLMLSGNEIKRILDQHQQMRPLLEHGTVDRLIRIYNRCRLFNVNENMFLNARSDYALSARDSTRNLKDLFKAYLEDLLGTKSGNKEDRPKVNNTDDRQFLHPSKETNELETLLIVVVQAHRKTHAQCDLTTSLMKEISDTNVPPSRRNRYDDKICDFIVNGIIKYSTMSDIPPGIKSN